MDIGIVFIIIYLWMLWGIYVLVMGIYRAHLNGKLDGMNLVLASPFVLVGFILDILTNITMASVIFVDPPGELLLTSRLRRYKASGSGWRYRLASWVCEGRLDIFDPSGDHC